MASLDHPNCVKVFEFFEEEGRAILVSEYVPGASLRHVADHAGHLTPEQALGVLKGALTGLGYAHGHGLVHRDIKPDNLLADLEGVSKLADFGQALVASGPGAAGGMPAGSPAYMSPEMISGGRVDLRTDIYSSGAMLFEFLTGRAPYLGDNPMAVMRKHLNDPVPDPLKLNGDLPEGVGRLVSRAMAKDPGERQRTAEQFLDELEAAAVAGYGAEWEQRSSIKRLVAAAAAALGLLLVGEAGALAGSGTTGQAAVGGVSRWLIAGGVAAVLVLAAAVYGLTHGSPADNSGGAVVLTSPSSSPSVSPSPSDSPSPSPSPSSSPSPSPSPSASPSPSPQPSPSPPFGVAVSGVGIVYEYCMAVCNAPQSTSPASFTCDGTGRVIFMEQYQYAGPGRGAAPVSITVNWSVSMPSAAVTNATRTNSHASMQARAGSGGNFTSTVANGFSTTAGPGAGSGTAQMFLSWTDPNGTPGRSAAPTLSFDCAYKP